MRINKISVKKILDYFGNKINDVEQEVNRQAVNIISHVNRRHST